MREILLNICLTSIALYLFKMLIPENTFKKQTDFLVACFFLSVLAFFFTSGRINLAHGINFSDEKLPYVNFEEEYAHAQKRAVEREIHANVSRVLSEEEIFPEEIYVIVNISDKYSISINEIRLVLAKQNSEGELGLPGGLAAETQESLHDEVADKEDDEPNEEELEKLREAVQIVQKEVGGTIIVSGEFKYE
ncbi:MAG: hypothetical protein FWG33_00250 [Oscillospiraceae bacterium]|nr:hypothetical protein [Oscillospiraceae bacterium]